MAPKIDTLLGLTPTLVAPPARATRGPVHSDADLAAASKLLAQTWDSGQALAFAANDDATISKLKSLFRFASDNAGTGLSLKVEDGVLYVRAIEKRQVSKSDRPRKPRETANTRGTAEYAAKMAEYEQALAEWEQAK